MSNNFNQFNYMKVITKPTSFEELVNFFESLRDKILMIEYELNKTNAIIENLINSKTIKSENDPKMESVDVNLN